MFGISVVWWWWALYTIAGVTKVLGQTAEKFEQVSQEVKEIKKEVSSLKD